MPLFANWFRPRCPVDPVVRRWIDDKLGWLGRQFPVPPDDRRTVLPTAEWFPDRYDQSDAAVRTLVDRVCGYMAVDPDTIAVRLFDDPVRTLWLIDDENRAVPTGAAGTYHREDARFVVRLERGQAAEPMHLVGTVAHELAHARLMGEGRATGDEFDNELLTDLAVVHFGLGLFLANVPRHWPSQTRTWPGTDVPRPRYMTTAMYGYALAARSLGVGDVRPKWRRALVPGARAELDAAVRFLRAENGGRR